MNVAIVGIQGVPAQYGGFESLVENIIGENAPQGIHYTIFCSSKDMPDKRPTYKNCTLRYVHQHANGIASTLYDVLSLMKCWGHDYDLVLILGVSGCLFLPVFRLFYGGKVVVNIDGLEHRRKKWGSLARFILRKSEAVAVRHSDVVIADNLGIQDYVSTTYRKQSRCIAYGGDNVIQEVSDDFKREVLQRYGVKQGEYAVTVCRIEPENNCHIILEAVAEAKQPMVFVGNWEKSAYGKALKQQYKNYPFIHIADPVYDKKILYVLRSQAARYIHGHSAGGTNPSLVEAMFFGIPILAYDVVYNRTTTYDKAYYFSDAFSLQELLARRDLSGSEMPVIAAKHYTWQRISHKYEAAYYAAYKMRISQL